MSSRIFVGSDSPNCDINSTKFSSSRFLPMLSFTGDSWRHVVFSLSAVHVRAVGLLT
jgi:hypothetical protein